MLCRRHLFRAIPARHAAEGLIRWFAARARDLPWRRARDPYAIWISEVMLQQTQVKTVIPYWIRWMRELPDVAALARADLQRVLGLWAGLGYYSRARNLRLAAQQILERHHGVFPRSHADVLELPGIGRYTAGAICSIAYNQPAPILDGNVIRVLTRFRGIRANARDSRTQVQLWELSAQLVQAASEMSLPGLGIPMAPAGACSALNQALMELGATVCSPANPKCGECPLARECVARRRNWQDSLPNLGPRQAPERVHRVVLALQCRGRWLVRQRPEGRVNAHLWEFPGIDADGADPGPALARERARLGLGKTPLSLLCRFTHSITRHRIAVHAYCGRVKAGRLATLTGGRWLGLSALESLPFAAAHRKILRQFTALRSEPQRRARTPSAMSPASRPPAAGTRSRAWERATPSGKRN